MGPCNGPRSVYSNLLSRRNAMRSSYRSSASPMVTIILGGRSSSPVMGRCRCPPTLSGSERVGLRVGLRRPKGVEGHALFEERGHGWIVVEATIEASGDENPCAETQGLEACCLTRREW